MRLDVSIVSAEQLFRAVDSQLLNHVDVFAAAVVTLARISFSVFVGQLRALRLHYARAGVVFEMCIRDRIAPQRVSQAFIAALTAALALATGGVNGFVHGANGKMV